MYELTIPREVLLTPTRQSQCSINTGRLFKQNPSKDANYMCCLGVILDDAGVARKHIDNVMMPTGLVDDVLHALPEHVKWLVVWNAEDKMFDNSHTASRLATINDDKHITNEQREIEINKVLHTENINATFTGSY